MVLGYKGFNPDMTCRGFQYEVGQIYEHDRDIGLCESGFHFCRNMADVLNYYDKHDCRYAVIEVLGKVINGGNKSVTDRIRIVRELTKSEVFDAMYAQSALELKGLPFPADEIIQTRENGALDRLLPSGTEFPVRFSNGEWNVLVVCRDAIHTYLVTKYVMAEPFAMNEYETAEGGWPACGMRKHVQGIYDMLPESFRKAVIPMRVRQLVRGTAVECDEMAFLLSVTNVFGTNAWDPLTNCADTQIDIFCYPSARIKGRLGASSASWWWLRSAFYDTGFNGVSSDGSGNYNYAYSEGGVVVAFCIEVRNGDEG